MTVIVFYWFSKILLFNDTLVAWWFIFDNNEMELLKKFIINFTATFLKFSCSDSDIKILYSLCFCSFLFQTFVKYNVRKVEGWRNFQGFVEDSQIIEIWINILSSILSYPSGTSWRCLHIYCHDVTDLLNSITEASQCHYKARLIITYRTVLNKTSRQTSNSFDIKTNQIKNAFSMKYHLASVDLNTNLNKDEV